MDAAATMTALKNSSDVLFLMLGAVMVFAMHAGFAFLEVGTVRKKNQVNALVKILTDWSVSTFVYFIIGFPLAYDISFLKPASELMDKAQGYDLVHYFSSMTSSASGRSTGSSARGEESPPASSGRSSSAAWGEYLWSPNWGGPSPPSSLPWPTGSSSTASFRKPSASASATKRSIKGRTLPSTASAPIRKSRSSSKCLPRFHAVT